MTRSTRLHSIATGLLIGFMSLAAAGCHDGPLYALKTVNPYYSMREWKRDRMLGVTDHERRQELESLASQIGTMDSREQTKWEGHLNQLMESDPSPEMRRLSVLAASKLRTPGAIDLIEKGLEDESLKVQMEACRSLGKRKEPEAAQLLASTLGRTTEQDIKNSAIAALGNHKGNIPTESLRVVLEETDPATVHLAMNSLRGVMGKDYGTNPKQWIAAIDSAKSRDEATPDSGIRFADKEDTELR